MKGDQPRRVVWAMTHRLLILLAVGCSAPMHSAAAVQAPAPPEAPRSTFPTPAPPPTAPQPTGYADVNIDNSLISNGSVAASSEHLLATASGFRREVYR